MKYLWIFFIFFSIASFGQDYIRLSGNDSSLQLNDNGKYLTYLIVEDSSDGVNDTVSVEIKTSDDKLFYPVGLKEITTDEVFTEAIPTNGLKKCYLIMRANTKQILVIKKGTGVCHIWLEYTSP